MFFHALQPRELQVNFELRGPLDGLKGKVVETRSQQESGDAWNRTFAMCGGDFHSAIIPCSRGIVSHETWRPPDTVFSE